MSQGRASAKIHPLRNRQPDLEMAVSELEDGLVRLDQVAESILRKAAPIEFGPALARSEREAVFRLRYQAVIDRGWGRPEDFPNGQEHESADERAVLIGGW